MKACPFCGYNNREGLLFCEDCGKGLTEGVVDAARSTRQFDSVSDPAIPISRNWGDATGVGEATSLVIHVRDAAQPIVVPMRDEIVVGRADVTSPRQPDVDLTPYGALEKGVSRSHAIVNRSHDTLTLSDMNSANGTYLNGMRLAADQPHIVRDGDEVRFGRLIAHIYFK